MFKEFGKAHGDWFNGSNFDRLINKGIVREYGVNEKNVPVYSLIKKGSSVIAPELFEKTRKAD